MKKRRSVKIGQDFICLRCGKIFLLNSSSQKFCGSYKKKKGCSYILWKKRHLAARIRWDKKNPESVSKRNKRYYRRHIKKEPERWQRYWKQSNKKRKIRGEKQIKA